MSARRGLLQPIVARLLRPLQTYVRRREEVAIARDTGLVSTDNIDPADTIVCGYPKSGNTWFQHLMVAAVYGIDPTVAPYSVIQEVIPDLNRKYYRRHGTPSVLRSHHLPRPAYRNVILLLRDGRDVMVSYYHHLSARAGAPIDFMRLVTTGEGSLWRWAEHTEAWLSNPYQARILTIRYEDLVTDCVGELIKACEFIGIEPAVSRLQRAATQCSFLSMQEKERTMGWGDSDPWPRDRAFVRRGAVGSYKDEMPPDVLQSFLEEAAPTLEKCGYL